MFSVCNRLTCAVLALAVCAVLLGVVNAQPIVQPTYSITPRIPNTPSSVLFPTCDPLVLSVTAAFVCLTDERAQPVSYVKAVSPANDAFTTGATASTVGSVFADTPQACGAECAVVSTRGDFASFALLNMTNSGLLYSRGNSTAGVVYDPAMQYLFVPVGTNATSNADALQVYDARAAPGALSGEYTLDFSLPYALGVPTLLGTPIVYQSKSLFLRNNTLYAYSESYGNAIYEIADPCGLGAQPGFRLHLAMGTYGQDQNGALDAFVIYGNTSSAAGDQFTLCRVSHNSGTAKWNLSMSSDAEISDVTFGDGYVILSGASRNPDTGFVWFVDAETGQSLGIISRGPNDFSSFPAFVGPGPSCPSAVAFQVNNMLTAFCPSTFGVSKSPIWRSRFPCSFKAVVYGDTLFCVEYYGGVVALNGTGYPLWKTLTAIVQPLQLMIDGATGGVYIFAQDTNTSLLGYQVATTTVAPGTPQPVATASPVTGTPTTGAPTAGPPGPPDNGGDGGALSGGAAAGLVVGLLVFFGTGGMLLYRYTTRRSKRHAVLREENLEEGRVYGALNERIEL